MNSEGGWEDESDLAFLDYRGSNPFELFKKWRKEAEDSGVINPDVFCLSTSSSVTGRPSGRHLQLRRLDEAEAEGGFTFKTDGRSRKSTELEENPYASMVFLWIYKDNTIVTRQVRIEGRVDRLSGETCRQLWDGEPLHCRIRSVVCEQGKTVDWQRLKQAHDDARRQDAPLVMPDYEALYRLTPDYMEFYHSTENQIADRLLFRPQGDGDVRAWTRERISA